MWCSADSNSCRKFYENDLRGRRPHRPCYESGIFGSWRFGPGTRHPGTKSEKPLSIKFAQKGKVALLTTRHPEYDTEDRRLVFGVFRINEIREKRGSGGIFLQGDSDHAIRLTGEAALSLPAWEFMSLPKSNKPDWRTGLVRYVSDREVTNFLYALRPYLQDARERKVLISLLQCCGSLKRDGGRLHPKRKAWDGERKSKYGPKGEGERHRRLKVSATSATPDLSA